MDFKTYTSHLVVRKILLPILVKATNGKIENSMLLLATLEHSNKEDKVLHQNSHENGLTFLGIYESMNPGF